MRYAELFAGAGGLSRGLEAAGMTCAWHAEIAPFPRRILETRWPHTPLYGDVSTLDGLTLVRRHGAIDLLAGGSPCQDLSVAGKRAGLKGSRSSLFHHQMRLWHETQATYCLWENVAGALSSNKVKDFGRILSEFVGAIVTVPRDKKRRRTRWPRAGVVRGPAGVAAWRVLDAQFFGVPQRRRRVFICGARAGGVDPAAVLLESEGVRWDSPARGQAREGAAGRARAGAPGESGVIAFDWQAGGDGDTSFRGKSRAYVVRAGDYTGALQAVKRDAVLAFNVKQDGADADVISPTLLAMPHAESHPNGGGQVGVLAFHHTQDPISGEVVPSLGTTTDGMGVIAFDLAQITSATNRSRVEPGRPAPTLNGDGRVHVCVTGDVTHALTHEGADASEDGTGRGTPIVARCVTAGEGKRNDWETCTLPVTAGIPRRLMPVECERLMSWPDGWTDVRTTKGKHAKDGPRYKACGNGVVSNCAEWIGGRLLEAERQQLTQEIAA